MTESYSLQQALDLLSQTQDQEKVDAGFDSLLKMADFGDMTAAAYIGMLSGLNTSAITTWNVVENTWRGRPERGILGVSTSLARC